MSGIKTTLLLGLMTGVLVFIGGAFFGKQGMVIALIFAGIMNFGSLFFSDKIVLAAYHCKEVSPDEAPELHRIVDELAIQAGIPKPKVYIMPTETPNAFATGRNPSHAAVAVTSGLLSLMSWNELKGVLAHELGHVKNRDTLISAVAATLAGAIMALAHMARWTAIFGGFGGRNNNGGGNVIGLIVLSIVTPIIAMLIQMGISRSREYKADETAARITKEPWALADALDKLEGFNCRAPIRDASPSSAHLFIVNPLNRKSAVLKLLSTHPPIEERISRLRSMTGV